MDKFRSMFLGEIDLDDPASYPEECQPWFEQDSWDLWLKAEAQAGRSLFYMLHIFPDVEWDEQYDRVAILCDELEAMRNASHDDSPKQRLELIKWLFRFDDETENQC